jgi:hypothetical protein
MVMAYSQANGDKRLWIEMVMAYSQALGVEFFKENNKRAANA